MSDQRTDPTINQVEHDSSVVDAKKVTLWTINGAGVPSRVGDSGGLPTQSANYAIRLDDTTTTNVTYVGKAAIGSSTASAVWQIQKMDETSGLVITWLDGNSNFDNVWDTRAAGSYS